MVHRSPDYLTEGASMAVLGIHWHGHLEQTGQLYKGSIPYAERRKAVLNELVPLQEQRGLVAALNRFLLRVELFKLESDFLRGTSYDDNITKLEVMHGIIDRDLGKVGTH